MRTFQHLKIVQQEFLEIYQQTRHIWFDFKLNYVVNQLELQFGLIGEQGIEHVKFVI